jgi:hypothetical protein
MTFPSVSLAQARQDVREKALALRMAEEALFNTRGCSVLVHPRPVSGCERCERWDTAERAVKHAGHELDAAIARFDAIESQQRGPLHVGGNDEEGATDGA